MIGGELFLCNLLLYWRQSNTVHANRSTLLTEEPDNRIANQWYDLSPSYSGISVVSFDDGDSKVYGKACASYDESGDLRIHFECAEGENSQLLEALLHGPQPGTFSVKGPKRPDSISIDTGDGQFLADYKVYLAGHSVCIGNTTKAATAEFGALGCTYRSHSTAIAKFVAIPLYNMISPSLESMPRPQPACVESHPLRIYPTPARSPDEDAVFDELKRNWHNRLITFLFEGSVSFIESLPDYGNKSTELKAGRSQREITAILVSDATSRVCLSADPSTWFPIDILNLLSLATGIRVGAPWIEYLDGNGQVLQRVHVGFGRPIFQSGHAFMLEQFQPNTAYFLTEGLKSRQLGSKLFGLLVTHVFNAGLSGRSVEDRLLSLARAFEAIAKENGLASQDLKAQLPPSLAALVTSELSNARSAILALKNQCSIPLEKKSIDRIAARVLAADQRDKNFGDMVADVADAYGFHDKLVLLNGFVSGDGNNWCGFLSYLRGAAVHEGGFDFFSGTQNPLEICRVSDHLHDLLIRVIIKSLDIACPYSTPLCPIHRLLDVDWVQPTTPSNCLIVPT